MQTRLAIQSMSYFTQSTINIREETVKNIMEFSLLNNLSLADIVKHTEMVIVALIFFEIIKKK